MDPVLSQSTSTILIFLDKIPLFSLTVKNLISMENSRSQPWFGVRLPATVQSKGIDMLVASKILGAVRLAAF
jgi:hypothetical protein